jgi:hypothetical protein
MNFKSYYKLTKKTTNNCFKICGIVFTGIYAVIAILTGYRNGSIVDAFALFGLCFLLGNALGLLIWILAITTSYKQVRIITKFYESIPQNTREKYKLILVTKPLNPKYEFLQLEIINTGTEYVFNLNTDKNFVLVSVYSDMRTVENFQKRSLEIQRKYVRENIVLTGWGLRKMLKDSEWRTLSCDNIDTIIERLIEVSEMENFVIMRRVINDDADVHK